MNNLKDCPECNKLYTEHHACNPIASLEERLVILKDVAARIDELIQENQALRQREQSEE